MQHTGQSGEAVTIYKTWQNEVRMGLQAWGREQAKRKNKVHLLVGSNSKNQG